MDDLIPVNKREIGFALLNGALGGFGTASGFVFSTLGFVVGLFSLTGVGLLVASIVALVVFVILAVLVGTYFFNRSLNNGTSLHNSLLVTNERVKENITERAAIIPPEELPNERPLEGSKPFKYAYLNLVITIKFIFLKNKVKESDCIADGNFTRNKDLITPEWHNESSGLQRYYEAYRNAYFVTRPQVAASLINSPTLLACINSFINYGCSLGPSLGLIGILSGIGVLGGLSTFAVPVLPIIIFAVLLVTIIGAYGIYYCECRNMERNRLMAMMETEISHLADKQKLVALVRKNMIAKAETDNGQSQSIFAQLDNTQTPTKAQNEQQQEHSVLVEVDETTYSQSLFAQPNNSQMKDKDDSMVELGLMSDQQPSTEREKVQDKVQTDARILLPCALN